MTINVFPQTPAVVNVEGAGSGVSAATATAIADSEITAKAVPLPVAGTTAGYVPTVQAGGGIAYAAGTGTVADATTTSKGVLQLAGDLAGTATAPTVPGLANKLGTTAQAADSAKINGIAVTGTPAAGQSIVASSTTTATWAAPTITGQYIGSASTFTGLPVTDAAGQPASNGDWAFLTADVVGTGTTTAPQYPRGAYVYNSTTYSLAVTLGADFVVGTTTGTVAAGNDSRITGAAQKSSNLSDLTSAPTARTNLGLGSLATVTPTGTASTTTYLRGDGAWAAPAGGSIPLGIVSVKDYGAVGDGTADDTTAVKNAIAAVAARNTSGDASGLVWFPTGVYKITSTLTVPKSIYLEGESALDAKVIYSGSAATGTAFVTFGTTGAIATYCGIRNIQINANNLLDWGVLLYGPQEGSGIFASMVVGGNVGGVDARSSGITGGDNKFEISNCWIWTNGDTGMYGVKFDDANGPLIVRNTTFQATNRSGTYPSGGPAGSAGIYANGGVILLEGVNCEHWESGICVDAWTRLTAIMPSTYTTTYGVRVRAIGGADTGINYRVENEVFSSVTYALKDEQNGLNLATLAGHRYDKFGPATGLAAVNARTASYTLGFGDRGGLVTVNSASATTITIPTNATTFMEVGAVINIANLGTGAVTIAGASGVTVSSPAGARITTQYGQASLIQTAANTWLLSGQTVV